MSQVSHHAHVYRRIEGDRAVAKGALKRPEWRGVGRGEVWKNHDCDLAVVRGSARFQEGKQRMIGNRSRAVREMEAVARGRENRCALRHLAFRGTRTDADHRTLSGPVNAASHRVQRRLKAFDEPAFFMRGTGCVHALDRDPYPGPGVGPGHSFIFLRVP